MPNDYLAVWTRASILDNPGLTQAACQIINEGETVRLSKLERKIDRRGFLAAHLLIRVCVGRYRQGRRGRWVPEEEGLACFPGAGLDLQPAQIRTLKSLPIVQRCPECGKAGHGRPRLETVGLAQNPHLYLSLSHSEGYVGAMVSSAPCGIDVQTVTEVPERALSENEQKKLTDAVARTRAWCRKETLVKAGLIRLGQAAEVEAFVNTALNGAAGTDLTGTVAGRAGSSITVSDLAGATIFGQPVSGSFVDFQLEDTGLPEVVGALFIAS